MDRNTKESQVAELKEKLARTTSLVLADYRGLTVPAVTTLRDEFRKVQCEYKVYKNTLVRLAAKELGIDIDDVLVGPTALAFISTKSDGTPGDIAAVAKAVQDFAKGQPLLVLKGGLLGDKVLDADGAKALASLPTAAEVYARLAGAVNGNARGLASVISGVHRSLAYVLQAAIDANVFEGDAPAPAAEAPAEAPADEAPADEAPAEDATADDAPADEVQPESAEVTDDVAAEATPEDAPAADAAEESEN